MRNMSFMLTTEQIKNRTKTVTRRLGWKFLKPGDLVQACVKCQGLGKGGKIEKLCVIRVVSVKREPLQHIWHHEDDVTKEGFPEMSQLKFVSMFCKEMKCNGYNWITRIEFEYVEKPE